MQCQHNNSAWRVLGSKRVVLAEFTRAVLATVPLSGDGASHSKRKQTSGPPN